MPVVRTNFVPFHFGVRNSVTEHPIRFIKTSPDHASRVASNCADYRSAFNGSYCCLYCVRTMLDAMSFVESIIVKGQHVILCQL